MCLYDKLTRKFKVTQISKTGFTSGLTCVTYFNMYILLFLFFLRIPQIFIRKSHHFLELDCIIV